EDNELFHILFDGSVTDEEGFVAMGGESEALAGRLGDAYRPGLPLGEAVGVGVGAITAGNGARPEAGRLEVALLDRNRPRRKFLRLPDDEVAALLSG
ncbi:MAG: proteasome subunit alpha, partial [Actinomycetota bacterium]